MTGAPTTEAGENWIRIADTPLLWITDGKVLRAPVGVTGMLAPTAPEMPNVGTL